MAPPLSAPLRAVLFDWGDTLFHAPHAPEVIASFARSSGLRMSEERAREMWDEIWAVGKTPGEIAKGRDQTLAQMALAWTLRDARMTSTLAGASSVIQLEANVGALARLDFSADELAEIDRYATDAAINLWARSSAT